MITAEIKVSGELVSILHVAPCSPDPGQELAEGNSLYHWEIHRIGFVPQHVSPLVTRSGTIEQSNESKGGIEELISRIVICSQTIPLEKMDLSKTGLGAASTGTTVVSYDSNR